MKTLDHRRIIEKCLLHDSSDITPISLWRHFPVDDLDPYLFSKAVITFQNIFDLDIVKVTPASCYSTYDWGTSDSWQGNPEGSRENRIPVITKADDWNNLTKLDVYKGFLGDQLKSLILIKKQIDFHTPVIETIFNPLSQAKHLAGIETLLKHIKENPNEVLHGLKIITSTTLDFIQACQSINIDGFFYAVQHAQKSMLSQENYQVFGLPFDCQISEAIQSSWLNMLHLHGIEIYFKLLVTLPLQIINWHDRHTMPSLVEARKLSSKCFCGGIRQWESLVTGNPESIAKECVSSIQENNGVGLILGTGCVTPITAPWGNIQAAINAARRR